MAASIAELLNVDESDREVDWLTTSLQFALELEFATIPLYLAALWSIKDLPPEPYPVDTAAGLLHWIALEEMLHLGLVCNMMTTLGATPDIKGGAPSYDPSKKGLPGGVRPDLTVTLAGLTRKRVKGLFMQIELPDYDDPGQPTIGAFYTAIEQAFCKSMPPVSGDRQLTTGFSTTKESLTAITRDRSELFVEAIQTIKDQGEGTSKTDPDAADDDLAHYFKFGSLHEGRLYVKGPDGWGYNGPRIDFPDVYDMLEVPADGYPDPKPEVKSALDAFNDVYTGVVLGLDSAWANGDENALNTAIGGMFNLTKLATNLYGFTVPGTSPPKTYGPTFRLTTNPTQQ